MAETSARWLIKRNCSASPNQLLWVLASVSLVSIAIALVFAAFGLWLVLPFAGLETLAIGVALVCHARHAIDSERIEIRDGVLSVQRIEASSCSEWRFALPWVQVELQQSGRDADVRTRVFVRGQGRRLEVGRFLLEGGRVALARELRSALRDETDPRVR